MDNRQKTTIRKIFLLTTVCGLLFSSIQVYGVTSEWKEKSDIIFNSTNEVNTDYLLEFQIVRTGKSNDQQDVEFSRSDMGVVDVLYNSTANKKIKVLIVQGDSKYTYTLNKNINYIKFPLQLGNGNYTISVYENVTGNKYKKLFSKQDSVKLFNPNAVFLNSIQIIDWKNDNAAIELAKQLIKDEKKAIYLKTNNLTNVTDESYLEKVQLTKRQITDLLYNYVVKNIDYDYAKIPNLPPNYIPNIEATLRDKKGICYDYSSLLASMLRSQAIPTKLIKGYSSTTDVYHAWNEIYLVDEGRWIIVDTTYDAYMFKAGAPYGIEKKLIDYSKNFEY